jgi:hypothetical protein
MIQNELVRALGGCKNLAKCACTVKNSFETVAAAQFYVLDDADTTAPVRIAAPNEGWQLEVRNPSGDELCLIKLDNCLVTTNTSRKCDCIVCGPEKCYLVEIKMATDKTRKDRRREAILQLGATVELLRAQNIDPAQFNGQALICFKNNRPIIVNAASSTAKASFLMRYGIRLEEKNTIEF